MSENESPEAVRRRRLANVTGIALAVLLSPLLIVLGVWQLANSFLLHARMLAIWSRQGRRVLFVYSDSPIWLEHVRSDVIPRLPKNAIILNWSEREKWSRTSLAVQAFQHFGGWREFNPLGVVIRPFRRSRVFRFWQPFRDYKHGKPESLQALEREFFKAVKSA